MLYKLYNIISDNLIYIYIYIYPNLLILCPFLQFTDYSQGLYINQPITYHLFKIHRIMNDITRRLMNDIFTRSILLNSSYSTPS